MQPLDGRQAEEEVAEKGLAIYANRLKALLEPDHIGKAVAIHVDTGDYALGRSHTDALQGLLTRHEPDGRIAMLTIGPPTDADLRLFAGSSPGVKP